MNKPIKWRTFGVLLSLLILLAGCGGGQETADVAASGGDGSDGPKYNFRLAESHPADYPTTKGDLKFAELVNERTNGRITIDVFPSAQLGEEKAAIEQVQLGAIEFTRISSGPLAEFNKDFGVFSLPYIFDSDEHLWKFLKSEHGDQLLNGLQSSSLHGLTYYSSGARSFYSSKPINTLDDMKNLKIRVQQNKINIDLIKALGASPTPMAYGEVYSSLQTGVIDAAENNYPSYFSSKHYEVAPYMIVDEHQRVPEVLLVSKQVWDKLSAEDQEIIKQAAIDSTEYQKEEWMKYDQESYDKVREGGAAIVEVKDSAPWREAVKPVIETYRTEFKDILEAIEASK